MPMTPRILLFTALAMLGFAGNSLFTRMALKGEYIDPASFMVVRIFAAALTLSLLVLLRRRRMPGSRNHGSWKSGLAFALHLPCFTTGFVALSAGTGALISFSIAQVTMIGYGLYKGERLNKVQWFGFTASFLGMAALLLPGITAPPLPYALLMVGSGFFWGIYSLRGRGVADPLAENAGNFLCAAPIVLLLSLPFFASMHFELQGVLYGALVGGVMTGLGCAFWFSALRGLTATGAASVQLSVPVLAAFISIPLLGEHLTLRLAIVSIVVLGGIALVVSKRKAA